MAKRPRFRLTSSVIRKITNCIFGLPYGSTGGNTSALYVGFNAKKVFVAEFHRENASFTRKLRISVSEPPFVEDLEVTYAIHL